MAQASNAPTFSRVAMARGVLILDENLLNLQRLLEEKNFKVYPVQSGMKDEQIAALLAHRIFVTNNAKDFLEAAAIHEFSIIDTALCSKDAKTLAQIISQTWINEHLKTKQPFLARLNQDGTAEVSSIEE